MATLTLAQQQTLLELDSWFRLAVDHPITRRWWEEADRAQQFYEGQQWTATECTALEARGQVPIVENETKPVIERLKGQFRRQRTTVKFVGRNQPDDPLAHLITDLERHIDQQNEWEWVEGEIVENGLVMGRGVLDVGVRRDGLGQPQVAERWEDPFCIFPDPWSRAFDWNEDARFVCRAKWMDKDQGLAQGWPRELVERCANIGDPTHGVISLLDPSSTQLRAMDLYYDHERRRFRPVEIWYKKRSIRRILMTDAGVSVDVTPLGATQADQTAERVGAVIHEETRAQMWVAVYCGGLFLDGPKPSPFRHNKFPFLQYRAYMHADGSPYGYVQGLLDPQREINARRSKALWALNNRQTLYEENAIKDRDALAEEMAKMDGQIEIRAGKFDRFQIKENVDISQGNLAMLQEAKMAMRRISGEDQLNPAPEVRSGVGIQRLQQIHQTGVLSLYDNIRRFRRLKALLVYELIRQYYTDAMVFQVVDDPNVVKTIHISADQFQTIKQRDYDLIVADTQDHLTAQSEQLEMLTTTLPQVIQYGPQWAALFISMSDLRNKDGLLKMLEGMTKPAPIDPKVSVAVQWNELTAEEKVAFAKRFNMPELIQGIAANPKPSANETQNQAEIVKTQMKVQGDVGKAAIAASAQVHAAQLNVDLKKEQDRERVSHPA